MQNFLMGVTLLATAFFLFESALIENKTLTIPYYSYGDTASLPPVFMNGSMFFVGDIMLARRVETYMDTLGSAYPFAALKDRIANADVCVGNFEGSIPPVHEKTPELTFRFSVPSQAMSEVREAGFDVLSLANNHSLDFHTLGYENTKTVCQEYSLLCFGHPLTVSTSSIVFMQVGSTTVGMIFIHTLFLPVDEAVLQTLLTELSQKSDVQIAYVHWGIEYDLLHSAAQEKLAKLLIDGGVDAVIGHHPHVVQDIDIYNGKPIFYSLGNCIFDQYFSSDVEQGLAIQINFTETETQYTLIPLSAQGTRSQPHEASAEQKAAMLERILSPITTNAYLNKEDSTISIPK